MLFVGLLFGVVSGDIAAHQARIDPLRAYVATLFLIIPALAGSRLLYVAENWDSYRNDLRRIWNRREGGSSMYGGLALALLASVPLLRLLRVDFGSFWDVSSFTILVGMIFTRVGCLLNGCCYGRTSHSPVALLLPDARGVLKRRLPTQVFEAAAAASLLLAAGVIWHWLSFPGALFLFVALAYSVLRFALEFAREAQPRFRGLHWAHAMSALCFFSCLGTLMLCWRR